MAMMTVTRMNDGFAFNAVDEAHNSMRLDIPVDQGGHGTGLRPMQTLLSALGACSGVDIVMILNKQKETIEFFEMVIDGERETGKEPALWTSVHIIFKFKGTMYTLSLHVALPIIGRASCRERVYAFSLVMVPLNLKII